MNLGTTPRRAFRALRYLLAYLRGPVPPGASSEEAYRSFLEGCRVALVGPAPTVLGQGQGETLEEFDRIIRLNHALPIPPELHPDVGTRTDVLYHNVWLNRAKGIPWSELIPILRDSVRWICATRPFTNAEDRHADEIRAFQTVLGDDFPFRTVSSRAYIRLRMTMRCQPNAGLMAIQDLLSFPVRELYITGFTFYQGGPAYYDGYRGVGLVSWLHPADRHIRKLAEWVRSDGRIRTDNALYQILKDAKR